ncbi:pyrimidine/purine nucleoside phosphorylase [Iodobacter sp. CM08]|uniref:pyrimidine/purine nucleoside phosphorylase n=1 Tax=Iodobacter sp. CM08 TaxID=3085902 RepID=UPI002982A983|nr:pyrimidine/purine nucleoside phosphorylase [Iodobacter sp. CM08]MDW5417603.1 pyrimidine/purine nucleoside phosphorylase [Iodobacter sp. CM08]
MIRYFDGLCVSHTLILASGEKKTVGVILPSKLVFNTATAEIMEVVAGSCQVKLADETSATAYTAGQSFNVPANSSFTIETLETLHYVCHFA